MFSTVMLTVRVAYNASSTSFVFILFFKFFFTHTVPWLCDLYRFQSYLLTVHPVIKKINDRLVYSTNDMALRSHYEIPIIIPLRRFNVRRSRLRYLRKVSNEPAHCCEYQTGSESLQTELLELLPLLTKGVKKVVRSRIAEVFQNHAAMKTNCFINFCR